MKKKSNDNEVGMNMSIEKRADDYYEKALFYMKTGNPDYEKLYLGLARRCMRFLQIVQDTGIEETIEMLKSAARKMKAED